MTRSILLGYVPTAMAFGAVATALHLGFWVVLGFSLFIYSGALQSAALGLAALNTSWEVMLGVALALNLRHMLYGPHLETERSDWSPWHRWLMGGLLTDELYAAGLDPSLSRPAWSRLGMTLYLGWVGGTLVGILASRAIPGIFAGALAMALPALFISLLVPRLQRRADVWAVVAAGLLALVGRAVHVPEDFYLIPIVAGATAGWLRQRTVPQP